MATSEQIKLATISVVESAIGHSLSELTDEVTQEKFPSVIQSFQEATLPDYPFAVVNMRSVEDAQGFLRDSGIDDNGVSFVSQDRHANFRVWVVGEDAGELAEELRLKIEFERIRQPLADLQATLFDSDRVVQAPDLVGADNYIKTYYIDFVVSYRHVIQLDQDYFDSTEVSGEMYDLEGNVVCNNITISSNQ